MNFAIIVAAGKGRRMKTKENKIFLKVGKKPIIYWAILNFEKHSKINKILIVTRKSDIKRLKKVILQCKFKKILNIIPGGRERQDSSFLGLKYLKENGAKDSDLILINNGANPLVDQKTISDVIFAAKKYGAAVCGFPARDTIKEIHLGCVKKTLKRKNLWQIQTPQGARFSIFMSAFLKAKKNRFLGTDDVVLVERLGRQVKIVKCPIWNIKMTYPEDIEYLKAKITK
jgi:2-C-methyl-D-erythritol 4-phosphate cytidylyltransferase